MIRKLVRYASPLVAVSVVLYLIALCLGIKSGMAPRVLLIVATTALTLTMTEAVYSKRSIYTFVFRLMCFFICWAGLVANFGDALCEKVCGIMAFICGVILMMRFVYFINKYSVRDADKMLD